MSIGHYIFALTLITFSTKNQHFLFSRTKLYELVFPVEFLKHIFIIDML